MTKTLKTMTLSMALAGMFLSAGAFAGAGLMPTPAIKAPAIKANVTVIHKNSNWPLKGLISTNTCALARCVQA